MDPDAVSNDTPLGNEFTHDPPGNGIPMDSPPPNGFPMDLLAEACSSFDSLRRSVDPEGLFKNTPMAYLAEKIYKYPLYGTWKTKISLSTCKPCPNSSKEEQWKLKLSATRVDTMMSKMTMSRTIESRKIVRQN
jgi:hypothetical protein